MLGTHNDNLRKYKQVLNFTVFCNSYGYVLANIRNDTFMPIIYKTDKRLGITYAYDSKKENKYEHSKH